MSSACDEPLRPRGPERRRPRGDDDWYRTAFELEVEFEFALDHVDFRGVMLRVARGLADRAAAPPGRSRGLRAANPVEAALTRGFGHFALDVPDVDAAYDALLAAGATDRMSPRPSPEPGVRMAYVADPEGNLVELLDRRAQRPVDERARRSAR